MKTVSIFIIYLLSFTNGFGQEWKNKLQTYFGDIPVCEKEDLVLTFLKKQDTSTYSNIEKDSISNQIERIYISNLVFKSDSLSLPILTGNISYYLHSFVQIEKENCYYTNAWTSTKYCMKNRTARKNYKKMNRKFSKYFNFSKKYLTKGLMGCKSYSTYYYSNKDDEFPVLSINWHNHFDLMRAQYSISILKNDTITKKECFNSKF